MAPFMYIPIYLHKHSCWPEEHSDPTIFYDLFDYFCSVYQCQVMLEHKRCVGKSP